MNADGSGMRVRWLHGDHAAGLLLHHALGSDNKHRLLVLLDDGTFRTFEAEDVVDEDQTPVLDDATTRGELAREDLNTLAEYLREHHGLDDAEPDEVDAAIATMMSLLGRVTELELELAAFRGEAAGLRTKVAELEAALAEAKKNANKKGSLLEKKQ